MQLNDQGLLVPGREIRNIEWFEDSIGPYWRGQLCQNGERAAYIGNYYDREDKMDRLSAQAEMAAKIQELDFRLAGLRGLYGLLEEYGVWTWLEANKGDCREEVFYEMVRGYIREARSSQDRLE